ncbi:hypothetical protein BON22_2298 [Cyberlindnera fabianii]|uniref:Meiotically up-regulated gene 157 protein n=1 Tax=Cyberlindnera fabianii TaxID=36022 RepID=A0A1V2L7D3_CYBFA|nr:hypothetical protein BON22_2298 [Cyberlindnera fabianii]
MKPYRQYVKPQYRRARLIKTAAAFVLAILFVLWLRRLGRDEEEDMLNERLQKLYDLSSQKVVYDEGIHAAAVDERPKKGKTRHHFYSSSTGQCEPYKEYSQEFHEPASGGPLDLPFQRPPEKCRTFRSQAVEVLIDDMKQRIKNPDLARLFENALPNTLDTTILYHTKSDPELNAYPQSFVVTGDIHAEWLRDAARQLSVYQKLTAHDEDLKDLIRGALNTQSSYILVSPYCNAFHPPPGSGIKKGETAMDKVVPLPQWKYVFECKWEVDSLASFLTLTNEYYEVTKDASIFNKLWINAMTNLLTVLRRESIPSFDENGNVQPIYYTFQRNTNIGTETLPLAGSGNPVNFDIGLIRSAFRPSDDACIYQFFIPGNAHMATELKKIVTTLLDAKDKIPSEFLEKVSKIIEKSGQFAQTITDAIYEHAVIDHPTWGKVFAYEIDGYGGAVFMDDANIPSLLALPDLGFLDEDDPIYQNTRKMILSKKGNPYYLVGPHFKGIGGPHIGIHNAWPMSLMLQIRTTEDDDEIIEMLDLIMTTTAHLGLIHESIHVNYPGGKKYTRPWFSWANSEFGKTILDLAERKPHLIFKDQYKNQPYKIENMKLVEKRDKA